MSCEEKGGEQSKIEDKLSEKGSENNQFVAQVKQATGKYDLSNPSVSYELPSELQEVSGLTYGDDSLFYMVQDEQGIIYVWDEKSQNVVQSQSFGKDGDYEGIEVVKDQIFVVKNTGTIFRMKKSTADELSSTKVGNFLKGDNDVEGLGFLAEDNLLLLACKEPYLQDGMYDKDVRSIYAFDIKGDSLRAQPWMKLNVYQLEKELSRLERTEEIKKVLNLFHPEKRKSLAPSGIAIHPITRHIYVLAHRSQLLLVLSQTGAVLNAYRLERELFEQPEGICFKPDGTLYISNESEEGSATLLGFEYHP